MPPSWLTFIDRAKSLAPEILIPVGTVIALVVLVLIWRALRRSKPDKVAVNVAVLLASAFSAQGMYEVATTRLHLPWYLAAGLFAVAEMAMLASAVRAHRHYEATAAPDEPGNLGPHQRFVWLIAACAGTIVSLNAKSPSEYFLRLLMPLLVAGLWRMGYVSPIAKKRAVDAITMRWTWRRIAEKWGIVEPGVKSLATASAERQVRAMTAHAHALHHGSILRPWHAARLRRLGLAATDEVVAAVQASVSRVHYIEDSTAPSLHPERSAQLPAQWWLHPWRSAKRSAIAAQGLRTAQETLRAQYDTAQQTAQAQLQAAQDELRSAVTAAQESARQAAQAILDAQRTADDRILRMGDEHRRALADRDAATGAAIAQTVAEQQNLHTAQLDAIRAQHAQELAAQRRPIPPRSTPAPRTQSQDAPRSTQERERSTSNAARLTDEDALDILLRSHPEPNYQWRPQEVTNLTDAAFRRAEKLLRMVAEHHERQARSTAGDADAEQELVVRG